MYKNKYKKYKLKYKLLLSSSPSLLSGGNNLSINSYLDNLYQQIIKKYNISANSKDNNLVGKHIYQTYGTILNSSLDKMIDILNISHNDIFYDLGSGIGNVCFKMLLSANVKKTVGYEVVTPRFELANYIKKDILKKYPQYQNRIEFKLQDFSKLLEKNYLDATIIFTDSIMFSNDTLKLIVVIASMSPNLRYLVSMKKIPFLIEIKKIDCMASWGKSQYYIYKLSK